MYKIVSNPNRSESRKASYAAGVRQIALKALKYFEDKTSFGPFNAGEFGSAYPEFATAYVKMASIAKDCFNIAAWERMHSRSEPEVEVQNTDVEVEDFDEPDEVYDVESSSEEEEEEEGEVEVWSGSEGLFLFNDFPDFTPDCVREAIKMLREYDKPPKIYFVDTPQRPPDEPEENTAFLNVKGHEQWYNPKDPRGRLGFTLDVDIIEEDARLRQEGDEKVKTGLSREFVQTIIPIFTQYLEDHSATVEDADSIDYGHNTKPPSPEPQRPAPAPALNPEPGTRVIENPPDGENGLASIWGLISSLLDWDA